MVPRARLWFSAWLCAVVTVQGATFGPKWYCAGAGGGDDSSSSESDEGDADFYGGDLLGGDLHGGDLHGGDRAGEPCRCAPLPSLGLGAKRMACEARGFTDLDSAIKLPVYIAALDLSSNPVKFLHQRFSENPYLRMLRLSNMPLIKVSDDALTGLANLTVLDLSRNRLEMLPDNFLQNQTSLKVLDVSSNVISGLPIEFFKNVTRLDTLSLSYNSEFGRYIHGSAEALHDVLKRGLRCLKIEHVGLSHIPENFFNDAYHLKELHISNNLFTTLPHLYLGSLQVLNVSGTNISHVGVGNFLTLPNLRRLYMENSVRLQTIDEGAFVGPRFLEVLSLEKCHNLSSFNAMAFGSPDTVMRSLKRLSLAHGGLQTLPSKLFTIFKNITDLRLHHNPWICDCKLAWLKKLNFSEENERPLRCFLPQSMRRRPWSSLEASNFVCVDKRARLLYGFMVTLCVIFSLVIVATLIAIGSTIRRRYRRMLKRNKPMPYDPMLVQLHPNTPDFNWEDTDSNDSYRPISFIRRGERL